MTAETRSAAPDDVTREELYDRVWATPINHLAAEYGVSGSYLARVCAALNVPRPPVGHWQKKAVGKDRPRPPLPEVLPGDQAVLDLHGGSPKGAERIAATWANNRKVAQVAFKPDWTKHAKAAPFKRNDQMLDTMPIGVIIFPGTGIQEDLADKAREMGIPVYRLGKGSA